MNNKNLIGFVGMIAAAAAMLLPGCATETTAVTTADNDMGGVLMASGFKARPATTAAQRNGLRTMHDDQFTVVTQNGRSYYLYVDKTTNRLYAGDEWAYRAYQGYVRN